MGKLIFSTLAFVAAGALLFMYIQPTYAKTAVTKEQIAEYEGALAKAAQLTQLQQSLLQRYNSFNPSDVSRLQLMLPDHADNIGLILELDSLASRYGLALTNVDVSSNANPTAPATSPADIKGAIGASAIYDSITLHFSTVGTYADLRSFLQDLEQSLRVADLVSLSLTPTAGPAGSQQAYTFDTSIKTYWLK